MNKMCKRDRIFLEISMFIAFLLIVYAIMEYLT